MSYCLYDFMEHLSYLRSVRRVTSVSLLESLVHRGVVYTDIDDVDL